MLSKWFKSIESVHNHQLFKIVSYIKVIDYIIYGTTELLTSFLPLLYCSVCRRLMCQNASLITKVNRFYRFDDEMHIIRTNPTIISAFNNRIIQINKK